VSESSGTEAVPSAHASRSGLHAAIGRALFSTRFLTIWLALGALLVVCRIVAPETLSSASWSTLLPTGSIVAVVALGQMAVIMMGGIDLSMGATISLLANVLVGVAKGQDDRLPQAILVVLVLGVVIGLVNGLLVAVLELNPLIVTLSTGLILLGITAEYRSSSTSNTMVPTSLSDAVFDKVLGISKAFWFVFVVMLVVAFLLRSSTGGRRFQAVGANRRVAWMAGIHVRAYVVLAYVAASIAAGVDVGGRLLHHHPQPAAAHPRALERLAVRRVRPRHRARHGHLRGSHRGAHRPSAAATTRAPLLRPDRGFRPDAARAAGVGGLTGTALPPLDTGPPTTTQGDR